MRYILLTASIFALCACQTTGPETKSRNETAQSDVVVTTGTRRAKVAGSTPFSPPPVPAANYRAWDGSVSVRSAPAMVSPVPTSTSAGQTDPFSAAIGNGQTVELVNPEYETITETVVVQDATTELVTVPPVYGVDGTILSPSRTVERTVPAVTKSQSRRVAKGAPHYVIRDESGQIIRKFESRDEFEKFSNNPYKRVVDAPVSTFSSDVDTASYALARSYLNRGQLPPQDAIRIEEVLNYFDYDYDMPRSEKVPFKPTIAVVPSPWNAQTKLVHIGVQGYAPPKSKRPPMNLVFLVDISGSMKAQNKLPMLQKSLGILLENLNAKDRVSIVTYGPRMETILVPTAGNRKEDIRAALAPLRAAGGTNGEAGLQQAYRVAEQSFIKGGANRVILATDGDFNIGISDARELKTFVEGKRDSGVYLSVLGFGNGNLKDNRMQALAQNGNGVAYFIDTLNEAKKVFGTDFSKSLVPIADDLKLQVEFNRNLVAEYRLLGYETRALKRQDFNNDKVDAGDIGAGHSVTAIYEIVPVGATNGFVDPLRYGAAAPDVQKDELSDEYGFLKLRYKRPGETKSTLISAPIRVGDSFESLRRAPRDTRWAVAAAGYGMTLRDDGYADYIDLEGLTALARSATGPDRYGYRDEFIELMDKIHDLNEIDQK